MDIEPLRDEIEAWLILLRAPQLSASRLRELIVASPRAIAALDAARRAKASIPARRAQAASAASPTCAQATISHGSPATAIPCSRSTSADFPPLLRDVAGSAGRPLRRRRRERALASRRSRSSAAATQARPARNAQASRAHSCDAGLAITSGLAEGIDAAAHDSGARRRRRHRRGARHRSGLVYPHAIASSPRASRRPVRWSASSRPARRAAPKTSRDATASSRALRSARSSSKRACAPAR